MDLAISFFVIDGAEAVLSKTVASPFERVRLLQQTSTANPKLQSKDAFQTLRSTMSSVVEQEGVKGFWRGNAIHCLSFYTKQAFRFGFQDEVKSLIPQFHPKLYPEVAFVAKTVSELVLAGALVSVIHPLELCRTRLATDFPAAPSTTAAITSATPQQLAHTYKGFSDCLQQVIERDGLRGVYRGFLPATLGMFQFRQGAKLCSDLQRGDSSAWLKSYIDVWTPTGALVRKGVIMAQSLALMVGNLAFVYPLDTIARRMKIDNGKLFLSPTATADSPTTAAVPESRVYMRMRDHIKLILRDDVGLRGFYRGFAAAAIHTTITYGMMTVFALFVNPHLQTWYLEYRMR